MGKLDRAVGALCLALATFGAVAASMSLRGAASTPDWLVGLSRTPAIVALFLSLLAALPGFVLIFRENTV